MRTYNTAGSERLIGFDARTPPWLAPAGILSADPEVWPSRVDAIGSRPRYIGTNAPFWESLYNLEAFCNGLTQWPEGGFFIVALSVFTRRRLSAVRVDGEWPDLASGTIPCGLQEHWLPLGFEVADRHLTSSMNGRAASGALNEVGLYSDIKDASALMRVCDSEDPAHAPFLVYALYQASYLMTKTEAACKLDCL